jgi:hypothetical protein
LQARGRGFEPHRLHHSGAGRFLSYKVNRVIENKARSVIENRAQKINQVTKRAWWMLRRQEPMKDVA